MKKLMLVLSLLLITLSFVACNDKKKDSNASASCDGYPAGYIRVTDQRMLQILNGQNGSYGNNYGSNSYDTNNYGNSNGNYTGHTQPGVTCVDQNTYSQLQAQVGGNGQVNCQQYPTAPGCSGYNDGGYDDGGYSSNPYCDYYPYSSYCWGYYYY